MASVADSELQEDVAQALVGDVDPVGLDAFRFARAILPVFPLVRALFSQSELDTCLKLMLLHELARAPGRSDIDRIRALVGFLDPGRVDALVRSLKEGGWLELRGADLSYGLSLVGLNLLTLLHAADVAGVTPRNVIARAAQTAELNARLDGAPNTIGLLLDHLRVLLEDEVAEARAVLSRGRPLRLVAWSKKEHTRQLDTVRAVLGHLQEQLDAASREFGRVVRLHETMQELVRMHTGIHARLREWNLDRLHTVEAGYAVQELAEAALGVDDATLEEALADGLVLPLARAPSLFTDELRARLMAARRRLQPPAEPWRYTPPHAEAATSWRHDEVDDLGRLRARLTRALADLPAGAPLELEAWLPEGPFPTAAWDVATLARLERDARVALDDGRVADVVVERELRDLTAGRFSRIRLAAAPAVAPPTSQGQRRG